MKLNEMLKKQLDHYRELIATAPDVETALDILDGIDLIFAAHVVDEKFGKGSFKN